MHKKSSYSSKDKRPGGNSNFKKDSGKWSPKDAAPFKKNYDGRSAASGTGKPTRSSKPYSGRVTDNDKPARSFDKPGYDKDRRSDDRGGADRKPRKFDKRFKGDDDRRPFDDRPKRSFDKDKKFDSRGTDRKPRKEFDKPYKRDNDRKPFGERPKRSFDKPSFNNSDGPVQRDAHKAPREFDKPRKQAADSRPFRDRKKSSFPKPGEKKDSGKENREAKPEADVRTFTDLVNDAFKQPHGKKKLSDDHPAKREQFEDKVYGELEDTVNENRPPKPYEIKGKREAAKKKFTHDHAEGRKKKYKEDEDDEDNEDDKEINQKSGPRLEMPLNKFIAHSGECSRREAAELVKQGKVKVNDELVLDPGYRVQHNDKVTMSGKKLTPQKGMVYILLNKPKGYITTNDDPQGRKTVMDLVSNSGADRLYPVGRLDRDTSGLLLITNDGELTQKLSHPSFNIKKVYHVTLDRPITKADFEKVVAGVDLEDGKAIVDEIAYLEAKNELGLEIHSGKNRIVRRIFESMGYVVEKLDRMMYAGLTKKNLPRGKWRKLDEREIVLLKHFKS